MKNCSLKCAVVLIAALSAGACSDTGFGPSQEGEPTAQTVGTTTTTSSIGGETPGPGEECYPELHGPTCVPNENSRTGYAIAN